MKSMKHILGAAAVAGIILTASATAFAQDAVQTTTTTTNTAGTISEFSPSTIVVKTTTDAAPVTYRYTKTTTYVDEAGQPVSIETVKSGLPVTVYYEKEGDGMVARKVIVRRAVTTGDDAGTVIEHKKTTTTTTTDR